MFRPRHAPDSRGPDPTKPFKFMVLSISSNELKINRHLPPEHGRSSPLTEQTVQSDEYYSKIRRDYNSAANATTEYNQMEHVIYMIGRTGREHGSRSICMIVPYHLGFVVEMPNSYNTPEHARKLIDLLNTKSTRIGSQWHRINLTPDRFEIRHQARAVGWVPDPADATKPLKSLTILIKTRNRQEYNVLVRFLSEPFEFEHHRDFQVSLWETTDYYSPALRFSLETEIDPGSWVMVNRSSRLDNWVLAQTDMTGICRAADLRVDKADERIEPITRACLDLECINGTRADRQKHKDIGLDVFPDPSRPDHRIIMAGLTFYMADGRQIRYLLQLDHEESRDRKAHLATTNQIEARVHTDERFDRGKNQPYTIDLPYECMYFSSEMDLILRLRDLLVWMDPDVVVSFNGDRFDYPYLFARVRLLGGADPHPDGDAIDRPDDGEWRCKYARMTQWGRLTFDHWTDIYRLGKRLDVFDYAADFKNKPDLTPQMSGRISLDLRVLIMSLKASAKYRFQSTSLDAVSDRFLGDKKIPMGHNKIFDSWFGIMESADSPQTPESQRMWLGHYCVKDVELPLRIIDNQYFIQYLIQMARITHTPPHNIVNNGQLMRVCAQFCHQARLSKCYVNYYNSRSYPYQGAYVLEPLIGFYGGSSETKQSCAQKIADYAHRLEGSHLSTTGDHDDDDDDDDEELLAKVEATETALDNMPAFLRTLPDQLVRKLTEASKKSLDAIGGVMLDRSEIPMADMWYNKRKTPAWLVDMLEKLPVIDRIEYESEDVVLTLDFRSLYPSIIRTNRFCPSTYRFRNRTLTGAEAWNQALLNKLKNTDSVPMDVDDDGATGAHDANDMHADDGGGGGYTSSDSESESESDAPSRRNTVDSVPTKSDPSGVIGPGHKEYDPNYTTICIYDPKTNTTRYHQYTVHQEGIFPELLEKLIDERDKYKDMVNCEKVKATKTVDPSELAVIEEMKTTYDVRQLALKISANSVYGTTGLGAETKKEEEEEAAAKGDPDTQKKKKVPVALCPLAESVTAVGRQMIDKTDRAVETKFACHGTRVIYGDSVTADTPILLLLDEHQLVSTPIDNAWSYLATTWYPWHGDKLAMDPPVGRSIKILSDDERGNPAFVPLIRLIKHQTSKAIYRITTNYGMVDATADHSLVDDESGESIRASHVRIGQRLRHIDMASIARHARLFVDPVVARQGIFGADKTTLQNWFLRLDQPTAPRVVITGGVDQAELGVQVNPTDESRAALTPDDCRVLAIELVSLENSHWTWVYDVQTASHHFHVGPGGLIVHNTDSVMVHMLQPDDAKVWQIGASIAHEITTNEFGGDHDFNELQFEKATRGFSLYSKKCYIGQAREKATDPFKEDKKGICTVRRDKPQVLTDLVTRLSEVAGCCYKLRRDVIARLLVNTCIDHFERMIDFSHGLDKYVICQSISKIEDEYVVAAVVITDHHRATVTVRGTRPPKLKLAAFENWIMQQMCEQLACAVDDFRPIRQVEFKSGRRIAMTMAAATDHGRTIIATQAIKRLTGRVFYIDKQASSAQITMARLLEERTGATISKGDAVYYVHVIGPESLGASQKVETPLVLGETWQSRIDRLYYIANKIEDQATKHLKIFLPPDVISVIFAEYRNAFGPDVRAMLTQTDPRHIRQRNIMNALDKAIQAGRLPIRNNLQPNTAMLNKVTGGPKRQSAADKARTLAKNTRRLDLFLGKEADRTRIPVKRAASPPREDESASRKRPRGAGQAPPPTQSTNKFKPIFE